MAPPPQLARPDALEAAIKPIARQIARLDRLIAAAIAKHRSFAALAKRLYTVPSVGPVTVAALIAWLPELGRLSRGKIAALVARLVRLEFRRDDRC